MRAMFMVAFLAAAPTWADEAEPAPEEELAKSFSALIQAAMPTPLYDKGFNWGHQSLAWNGVTWEKNGIFLKPHKQKKFLNEGVWRKVKVEAINPDKSLQLVVKNVQKPEKGKVTFDVVAVLLVRITMEQQLWKNGTRLYSGETRARCRPILMARCESTTRTEKKPGATLPEVFFRMRVVEAKLSYDQFKVEHTAGVGGEIAEQMGNALHGLLKQIQPGLEKNMLEKANQQIVKVADTKEVKLGLGKFFDRK